jgi:hypothetical protein
MTHFESASISFINFIASMTQSTSPTSTVRIGCPGGHVLRRLFHTLGMLGSGQISGGGTLRAARGAVLRNPYRRPETPHLDLIDILFLEDCDQLLYRFMQHRYIRSM